MTVTSTPTAAPTAGPGPAAGPGGSGRPDHTVVVIGAGFGGIGMGVRLQRMGLTDWVLLEGADRPGGVWRENTYPGAACDVPSHLYSYSWDQPAWSRRYSGQAEILRYLEHEIAAHDLGRRIRYGARVAALRFDDALGWWHVELESGETLTARAVVSAVGQLTRPTLPVIPGIERFAGRSWHSARWPEADDLTGRRVAVIGTGTSAMQFVPEIAKRAAHVDIYQRSAPYVLPKEDRAYGGLEGWLFGHVPGLDRLDRLRIFLSGELLTAGYVGNRRITEKVTAGWRDFLEASVADPGLRARCTPDYQIGCKRIGFSNDWYPTIVAPHVDLVTDPIGEITAQGVVAGGVERPADVLITATGFTATDFLAPMTVEGRSGVSLRDTWADGAEAYLGVAISHFPNLFLLYGPNSNLGANSIVYMLESQIAYVAQAVELIRSGDVAWLDVRPGVQDRYNRWVQDTSRSTTYRSGCHSWYTTASGKNTNNWPTLTFRYRRRLRTLEPTDFEVGADRSGG
jgi:cation diffusion facilitator CzcD-associated flavoprotein CzcO